MTTPRVTVPVEPTEAMIEAVKHHWPLGYTENAKREDTINLYRAMLSAAPAPEGGAVLDAQAVTLEWAKVETTALEEWRAEFGDYVALVTLGHDNVWSHRVNNSGALHYKTADDAKAAALTDLRARLSSRLSKARQTVALYDAALAIREEAPADHHERNLSMTNDELIEQALSHPPLEAPAEAGEDVNWKAEYEAVCAARISDRQKSQEIINERDKWIAELIQERESLRAQPQAREDAQPVGWRLLAQQQPKPGHKIITLHDDGSGAALLFVHDGGVIDSDGDDYDTIGSPQTWWAYLPDEFEFWCEGLPEEPVTLPAHRVPDHPDADALRVVTLHQMMSGEVTDAMRERYGATHSDLDLDELIEPLDYGQGSTPKVADIDRLMSEAGYPLQAEQGAK